MQHPNFEPQVFVERTAPKANSYHNQRLHADDPPKRDEYKPTNKGFQNDLQEFYETLNSLNLRLKETRDAPTCSTSSFSSSSSSPSQKGVPRKIPLDLSHHLNNIVKNRYPSVVKDMYKYYSIPRIKNLAGGLPCPDFFPFDTLEGFAASPWRKLAMEENASAMGTIPRVQKTTRPQGSNLGWLLPGRWSRKEKADHDDNDDTTMRITIPKYNASGTNPFMGICVSTMLQYGAVVGFEPLLEFIRDFSFNHLHKIAGGIPYNSPGPDIILTCGNTDGLNKVFEMLLEEGDSILVEEFTYMNTLQAAQPLGASIIPVKMDEDGACPEDLDRILSSWADEREGGRSKKPKIFYTIAIGQNPTGMTMPIFRKREIYSICEKHDIIIVEDEPYWHLQYRRQVQVQVQEKQKRSPCNNDDPFLKTLVPSYLTLDTSGRVIRLDTFSKTIAPGCRLGWVTAQPAFIERLLRITETGTQHPSGFVQAFVTQLLVKKWGMDGWIRWLENLRNGYENKMWTMIEELEKGRYLLSSEEGSSAFSGSGYYPPSFPDPELVVITKTELITYMVPDGGMFLWIRVNISSHPLIAPATTANEEGKFPYDYLMNKLWIFLITEEGGLVLVVPGHKFAATEQVSKERKGHQNFRLAFCGASNEAIREGIRSLCLGVKKFWRLKPEEIEAIGSDKKEAEMGVEEIRVEGRSIWFC